MSRALRESAVIMSTSGKVGECVERRILLCRPLHNSFDHDSDVDCADGWAEPVVIERSLCCVRAIELDQKASGATRSTTEEEEQG